MFPVRQLSARLQNLHLEPELQLVAFVRFILSHALQLERQPLYHDGQLVHFLLQPLNVSRFCRRSSPRLKTSLKRS